MKFKIILKNKLKKVLIKKSIQTLRQLFVIIGGRGRAFYNLVKNSKA